MQRTERLLNPYETAAGAVIVSIVGGVIVWLQSIWKKAVKSDIDAVIVAARAEAKAEVAAIRLELEKRSELIDRRISAWEQRSGQFVTREAITELERKMDKMESQIEKSINRLSDKFDKMLEGQTRHS